MTPNDPGDDPGPDTRINTITNIASPQYAEALRNAVRAVLHPQRHETMGVDIRISAKEAAADSPVVIRLRYYLRDRKEIDIFQVEQPYWRKLLWEAIENTVEQRS